MTEGIKEIGGSCDDRPYGIFADKVVYDFLCAERVIRGNFDLAGVVHIGDENGANANILWALDDFRYHCSSCKANCIQEQKEHIIELFQTGKLQGTIGLQEK
ncbi:MAG: hypothetical protein NTX91_00860 [candidate division SR1 bacterium]|nr:hypothetical protein [candidate division SR1 bacterium]